MSCEEYLTKPRVSIAGNRAEAIPTSSEIICRKCYFHLFSFRCLKYTGAYTVRRVKLTCIEIHTVNGKPK